MNNRHIALLTDFGLRDPYVGMMKSVILSINPSASIIDLCHEIDPGDVQGAAFALAMAFPYLPEGTVFVTVVDPGVGTARRPIAVEIEGRFYVGPDNGLLSWVLKTRKHARVVELTNKDFQLPETSSTFHGRDIFAPVAAHLAKGISLDEIGTALDNPVTFPLPEVIRGERSLQGEVIYIDHFGNLLTNITRDDLKDWEDGSEGAISAHIGSVEIKGISGTYGEVPHGHPAAVLGSAGELEIAVNGGNAADFFGAVPGSSVFVYCIQS